MSEMNINAIRSLYEAYRRNDIPAIFEVFDAEIEIYQTELLPWGGDYRGQDEARKFFAKLTQHIDSRVDVERFIDADDHVVVLGYSRGSVKATGREFEVAIAHVWTMSEGKAHRFEAYIETPKMLRAMQGRGATEENNCS